MRRLTNDVLFQVMLENQLTGAGDVPAGRYDDDATLFRLAGQLEKELPWNDRKPPVWN